MLNSTLRLSILIGLVSLQSCGLGTHYFLGTEELEKFQSAGPILPEVDAERILSGLARPGQYTLVAGDLLEIAAPATLFLDPADPGTGGAGVHVTRVNSEGEIVFPMVGALPAAGRTLAQIEEEIAQAVFPKFVRRPPSVVARVSEYRTERVTVVGAVGNPGIVELRSDRLSLFSALEEAQGITKPGALLLGAKLIRIRRPGEDQAQAMVLPVKGLNVPVGDVALEGGETIEVERYEPDTITILGLVGGPGVYSRPPVASFNLIEALATAGGTEQTANPPYATVFRRAADGEILPATFAISGEDIVGALDVEIKTGDVIVVAHTAASWTRAVAAQVLRVQIGFVANNNLLAN